MARPRRPKGLPPICFVIADELAVRKMERRELAERIGVHPTVISHYAFDRVPDLERIHAIEAAFGMRRGELLVLAGEVDHRAARSTIEVLENDPALDATRRRLAIEHYRWLVSESASAKKGAPANKDSAAPARNTSSAAS